MNYFTDPELTARRQQGKHYKFSADFPEVTWAEVLRCLDYSVKLDRPVRTMPNFGIVVHDLRASKGLALVLDEFALLDPEARATGHLYLSLTSKAETIGWHSDTCDVIYWQAIGVTEFAVEDNGIVRYTLQPGDAIYIPKGMMHDTKPMGPRCGVSMGLEKIQKTQ